MTLIDRYVIEVARHLPRRRRADISRELRSTLLDALESRFGASPTEDDAATVLREFGPPQAMAASYQPSNQYLIGPEWFPTYKLVLRIHLIVLVAVLLLGFALQLIPSAGASDVGHALGAFFSSLVQVGLILFGMVTVVFYLLERGELRSPADKKQKSWNPHRLPVTRERDFVGRGESLLAIVSTAVAVVLLYEFKNRIGIPYGDNLLLNGVFLRYLPWLAAAMLLTMAQYGLLLWQGRWHWYTRLSRVAVDLFGVYVVYLVANAVVAERETLLAAGLPIQAVALLLQLAAAMPYIVGIIKVIENAAPLLRFRNPDSGTFPSGKLPLRQAVR